MRNTRKEKPPELAQYRTSGELGAFLGKSVVTVKRWRSAGIIPPPAARSPHGWGLWSPEQCQEILRKILK